MARFQKVSTFALSPLMGILILCFPTNVRSQSTTDYLIQMVCLNEANQPYYGDPFYCQNKRKLLVGEALPYHKIDFRGIQISDSFPISDSNGISVGVQSYFFVGSFRVNPLFPNTLHFNPLPGNFFRGGYNIIGADESRIFFRGTSDYGSSWSPWWTPDCRAEGWGLLPNAPTPIAYGGEPSPTINYPNCSGMPPSWNKSTVEWNSGVYTYQSGKSIPTVYDYHYAEGYDALEVNYFTEIYGVTRFEAWQSSNLASTPGAAALYNCPSATHTAFRHNRTMYMIDCRDWTTLYQPPQPWNPSGTSALDPKVRTWHVDPLYTGTNLLKNTHIGRNTRNPAQCQITPWERLYNPANVLNWGWAQVGPPFEGATDYGCVLQYSISSQPNGEVIFQRQTIMPELGTHSYGAMLWTASGSGSTYVAVIQRDSQGNLTGSDGFLANVSNIPNTFADQFQMNPATTQVFFAMYPQTPNVGFNFTGSWITKVP